MLDGILELLMENSGSKWLPLCSTFDGVDKPPVIEDFTRVSKLGKGAYGQVFKVAYTTTGKQYAMKVITKQTIENLRMKDQLKNEFDILQKVSHPNIIQLIGYFEDARNIYFLLELADDDHLYAKLNKVEKFDEPLAAKYMFDMFQAVNYLHKQNPPIIHRDIKPENILSVGGSLKLADFGWSNMKGNKARTTYCGTPDYLAPEMVDEKAHTEKLDLWTLGVLLYELVVGKAPFTPSSTIKDRKAFQKEQANNIRQVKVKYPSHLSKVCQAFIARLLQKDFKNRPSCEEALQDQFFKINGFIYNPSIVKGSTLGSQISGGDRSIIINTEVSKILQKPIESNHIIHKLPTEYIDLYKQDVNLFVKEITRVYLESRDDQQQLRKQLESKADYIKRIEEEKINLQSKIIIKSDSQPLTQEEYSSLYKKSSELNVLRAKHAELQEVHNRIEQDKNNLIKLMEDVSAKYNQLKAEKDMVISDKNRLNTQLEDLKYSQIVHEQDWIKEKEILANNNEHMVSMLNDKNETRPSAIQASLLKIIDMMSMMNIQYKDMSNSQKNEGIDNEKLMEEYEQLKREVAILRSEKADEIQQAREEIKYEYHNIMYQQIEEHKTKTEKVISDLRKKIDDLSKELEEYKLYKDKIGILNTTIKDKDMIIETHIKTESSLQIQKNIIQNDYNLLQTQFSIMNDNIEANNFKKINSK